MNAMFVFYAMLKYVYIHHENIQRNLMSSLLLNYNHMVFKIMKYYNLQTKTCSLSNSLQHVMNLIVLDESKYSHNELSRK